MEGMADFFAKIPCGKEDKPMLLSFGEIEYRRDDIDGQLFMLDRDFSGCIFMAFSKQMDPGRKGKAYIDGQELQECPLKTLKFATGVWMLGVPVRGYVNEYGKTYNLRIEGFYDTDGNEMIPFEAVVKCTDKALPQTKYAEHEAIALEAAREGIVLLKNNARTLPVAGKAVLNIFGKGIHQFRTSAVGAGKINPRYSVDLLEALEESELEYNRELVDFYRCDKDILPPETLIAAAKAKSDIGVVMITRATGENLDNSTAKGEYYLTDDEENLIKTVAENFARSVVVLNVGYPIDTKFAEKYGVKALVYNGFGGMLAGRALVDVISGKVSPSGKLPDTWARDYFDIPASRNFYNSVDKPRLDSDCGIFVDTCYEEDIYVGYRYFTSFGKSVAFPFGYGMSYTSFSIEPGKVFFDGTVKLNIKVTNTGAASGKEVVQVYIRKPSDRIETPERELVFFAKTKLLAPGDAQVITALIPKENLTVYDVDSAAEVMLSGEYIVFAGNCSACPPCGKFSVEKDEIVKKLSHLMLSSNPPKAMSVKAARESFPKGERSTVRKGISDFSPREPRRNYPSAFKGRKPSVKITYKDLLRSPERVDDFIAQMSVKELARLCVCASHGWGMEGIGEAGRIYKVEGYELPDFPVSDGNSGVNLKQPNIGMPSGATMAASFNTELMENIGRVIGEEAKELGIPLILAPGMNLHRNPLNGRQPEYFSEDPYHAGVMAGMYCKGMESAGVGSCIKHMIGNNCESTRKRNNSIIGERALRELYLKPFEVAMSVYMPASVMTAYNAVNGCPTSTDSELILGFLREENGFDGVVMTDWNSYDSANVAEMVQAGNCWITPGTNDDTYTKPIVEGVASGKIDEGRLRENAAAIIRTILRFDPKTERKYINRSGDDMKNGKILCNPLNLNYRYQHLRLGRPKAHRESADPTLVLFKDKYYLFASMGGGFWHSDDLINWTFKECTDLMYLYAPDVRQIGDYLYFCASTGTEPSKILRSKDPLNEPFELVSAPFAFWDPDLFEDDDKRVYLYWGCNNREPIYGIELDRDTMLPIGEKKGLIIGDIENAGWERAEAVREAPKTFMDKQKYKFVGNMPFIEGAYVNKYNGKYYLQYAGPGTEYFSYGDGVAVADYPLGEFKRQAHNPFSSKPGGFFTAAGHGSTIEDKYGNFWHIASMRISVNASFERRLGLFPAGFDEDGILFCNQNFGDYPLEIPAGKFDPMSVKPKWMLLSYKKNATASSVYKDHTPELGVNEDVRTSWCAKKNKPGEWYMVDLGKNCDVRHIQINFADVDIPNLKKRGKDLGGDMFQKRYIDIHSELYTRWLMEVSEDGKNWAVVADKRNADTNFSNDVVEIEEEIRARYIRVTGQEFPYNARMAISGLRIFGNTEGDAPEAVANVKAERKGPMDASFEWAPAKGAIGYNVRYGIAPDKLYSSWQLYDTCKLELPFLNAGQDYYFAIDSYNECGITEGKVTKL